MSKKITLLIAAGFTIGIAIYRISRVITENRRYARNEKDTSTGAGSMYPYEYSL